MLSVSCVITCRYSVAIEGSSDSAPTLQTAATQWGRFTALLEWLHCILPTLRDLLNDFNAAASLAQLTRLTTTMADDHDLTTRVGDVSRSNESRTAI